MSKLLNQWVDIFRVGDYGEKGNFTEADLDRVAASYSPTEHEAPVVIGHPAQNLPAYGWVDQVRRVGQTLQAKFAQVEPQFAEMVEAGRFKQRSASFYKDAAGKISGLRHVGFLGAQPPEVKGLKAIQFSEQESTEVDFQEASMAAEDSIIARLNAWLDEKFPKNAAATATFSEADVKRIAIETATAAVTAAVAPLQAKLDAQTTSFSESQAAAQAAAIRARAADAVSLLKSKGKWIPAFDKMGLPVVFAELAKTTDVVEFGEGAAKKSQTPLDTLVSFMEGLGSIVPAGTVYSGGGVRRAATGDLPANVDPNSAELDALVKARMKEKGVSYTVAFDEISKDHVHLMVPGGATAGAV